MEYNNNKMNFSLSRLIIMLIMLTVVIVGGTFAWFTFSSKQSALVLTVGDINDTQIKLSPYQIKGEMTPVNTYTSGVFSEVEVTNGNRTTSVVLYYKINDLDVELIDNGLAYTIVNTADNSTVKTGYFSDLIDTSETLPESVVILDQNTTVDSTTNYKVYLWLDSTKGNQNDVQGSSLDIELNGSIGSVTISGTNTYGQQLTANVIDTNTEATYTYQWFASDTNSTTGGTAISEVNTSNKYIVGSGLTGKYIYVVAKAIEDYYDDRTYTDVTDVDNNGSATVSSKAATLKVTPTSINLTYPSVNSNTLSYTYDGDGVVSCKTADSSVATCSVDTTNKKVIVTSVSSGSSTTLTLEATVGTDYAATISNNVTVNVVKGIMTAGTVTISGTSTYNETLTATVNLDTSPVADSYSYQWWYATSATATSGTNISGATSSTYKIGNNLVGKYIGVTVTAKKTNYNDVLFSDITSETVSKANLTITAKDQTITYGSSIATGTGQITSTGLVSGYSVTSVILTPSTSSVTTNGTIIPSDAVIKNGTVDVTSNYNITYTAGKLVINAKNASNFTITLSPTSYTYDGTAKTPTVTVKDGSTTLTKDTHYTVAYSNNTNVGTATVTVTGKGNYTGTKTATFTINKASITITAKDQTITYGSSIATGTGQITSDGLVSGHSVTSVTLTPSTSSVTTNGAITPSGAVIKNGTVDVTSNYNITYTAGKLVINASDASNFTITLSPTSYTYDGTAKTPTVTVKDGSTTLTNDTHYTVAYSNNTNVGTATVTVTGKGNYTGTKTATFVINKASITITAKDQTITYGSSIATGTGQITSDGLVSGHSVTSITLTPSTSSVTANGVITPKSAVIKNGTVDVTSNYNITYTAGKLVINAKNASNFTITLSPTSYTYDGTAKTPTVTVKDGSTTLTNDTHYTVAYSNNTNVGTATVTVTGKGNYTGTKTATFTINKASCACTISSTPTLKYLDSVSGNISYSCTGDGTISIVSSASNIISTGSAGTSSATLTGLRIGTSTITVSQAAGSNYNACTSATKDVTVSGSSYTVTANSQGGSITSTSGWTGTGTTATKSVTYSSTYGTLPTVSRSGYTFNGWQLIPDTYQQVDFIQSSGTQYIDTGYAWENENIEIYLDAIVTSNSASQSLFGNEEYIDSGSTRYFAGVPHGSNGTYNIYLGNGGSGINVSTTVGTRFNMNIKTTADKLLYVYKDGTLVGSKEYTGSVKTKTNAYTTSTTATNIGNIFLFANRNSNKGTTANNTATQQIGGMKVYSFKLYDNNVLVRDMIPCYRKSDNVVGMYDLVNGVFYTNMGTGSFTKGSNTYVTSSTTVATAKAHTIYANWSGLSYTLTANANGGTIPTTTGWTGTGTTSTKTITYNSTYGTLPTPTRTGYTFSGWYDASSGGNEIESTTTVSKTTAHTIYARWTPNTYTITLDNQSATSAGTQKVYYQYNTTKTVNGVTCYYYTDSSLETCLSGGYTITIPSKTGYSFNGYWSATGSSGTQYVNTSGGFINNAYKTFTQNITLYAGWKDTIAPTVPTYVASFADGSGNYSQGTWVTKQVNTAISSTDAGTGVHRIQYILKDTYDANNNASWNTFNFSVGPLAKSGTTWTGTESWGTHTRNQTYYFRACDYGEDGVANNSDDNCSSNTGVTYTIKYDQDAPTVSYTAFYANNTSQSYTSGSIASSAVQTRISGVDAHSGISKIQYVKKTTYDNASDKSSVSWTTFQFGISALTQSGTTWSGTENWAYTSGRDDTYYFRACDAVDNCTASSGFATFNIKYGANSTVTYDANGGSGAPSAQTKTYGTALTLSSTEPTRTGYTFKNWNTKADGSGTSYNSGASYTTEASTTLYAQWVDSTAPTTPTLKTIYDIWGNNTYSLRNMTSGDVGVDGTWTTGADSSFIFSNLSRYSGINGAYVKFASALSSSLYIQIFYAAAGAGYSEANSNAVTIDAGVKEVYIPFTNSGTWTQLRFDLGNASGVSFKISSLGVSANADQWNNNDIYVYGTTTESGSGVSKWRYSYLSTADDVTGIDTTGWVEYSNSSSNSFIAGPFSAERNQSAYFSVCDISNNCSGSANTKIMIDTTVPSLTLSKQGEVTGFKGWNLNGATLDSANQILTLDAAGDAPASPYYHVDEKYYNWSYEGYTDTATTSHTPKGGVFSGTQYWDSSFAAFTGSNGYAANGQSTALTLDTWTSVGGKNYNYGTGLEYATLNFSISSSYSNPTTKYRNFKIYGDIYDKDNYIITSTASDSLSGVKAITKPSDCTSTSTGSTCTSNKTYSFTVTDNAGNTSTKTIAIDKIDTSAPTVGSSSLSGSTLTTTSSDTGSGIVAYTYTTSTSEPTSYTRFKTNTSASTTKSISAAGTYYLWLVDGAGNVGSNVSSGGSTIYSVAYNACSGSGAPSTQYKLKGSNLTLSSTTPTRSNYTFSGWSTTSCSGSVSHAAGASFTTDANTTLYAIWSVNSYTLTANANGGSISSTTGWSGTGTTATKNITPGSTYGTLPTVSRTGYTLKGWYDAASGGNKIESTTAVSKTTAHTIYAQWTADNYTVNYNCGTGTGTPPGSQTVAYGSTITINGDGGSCSKAGHSFATWNDPTGDNGWTGWTGTWNYPNGGNYGVANNTLTLTAAYTPKTYTVKYSCGTGTGTAPSSQTVTYGSTITINGNGGSCSKAGYTFSKWADPTGDTSWTGWTGTWKYSGTQYGIVNDSELTLTAQWVDSTAPTVENLVIASNLFPTKSPNTTNTMTVSGNNLTTSGTDPFIVFSGLKIPDTSKVIVTFGTAVSSSFILQTFYATSDVSFSEANSVKTTVAVGTTKVEVTLPGGTYTALRFDFGDKSGVTFNVAGIDVVGGNVSNVIYLNADLVDSGSKVSHYAITTSSTTPTSWTDITDTSRYHLRSNLTSTGKYYVWAKDAAGIVSSSTNISYYKVSYNSNNLVYNFYDGVGTSSANASYSVSNGVVTVTANADDGYVYTRGRVYLEANRTYIFNCDSSGTWGGGVGDTVEAFLMLDGGMSAYYHMGSKTNYSFTPTVSGVYWLRFDTNQSGKTHTFSNINISYTVDSDDAKLHGIDLFLTSVVPTRSGYEFLGWSTNFAATSATYDVGDTYSSNASTTFYAIWEKSGINPISSYSCANGSAGSSPYDLTYTGNCTVIDDGGGNWRVKFLSTGTKTLQVATDTDIDAFLVGGGGGGTKGGAFVGGGGGGGGYVYMAYGYSLTAGQNYSLTIGAGGAGGTTDIAAKSGGTTSGFGGSAAGGAGGTWPAGGNGGSGGGGGGDSKNPTTAGAGGSYGSAGGAGYPSGGTGGTGQGVSTCEFHEGTTSGCTKGDAYAYAGGGGGAGGYGGLATPGAAAGGGGRGATSSDGGNGSNGTANTGGGGGGGGNSSVGGAGGSGIIVIRNKR